MILLRADATTRLSCKLVCREWYDMITQDVIFMDGRVAVIRHQYLTEGHPAVEALSTTSTRFQKLIISGIDIDPTARLDHFWKNLGSTVTELMVLGGEQAFITLQLRHFPQLHTVFFEKWSRWSPGSSRTDEELINTNHTFPSVRTLIFQELSCGDSWTRWQPKVLAMFPNLQEIKIAFVSFPCIEQVSATLRSYVAKVKQLPYHEHLVPLIRDADLTRITFLRRDYKIAEVNSVIAGCPSLQSYAVQCCNELPDQRVALVQKLNLTIKNKHSFSLGALRHFTGLRVVCISVWINGCFWGHDSFDTDVTDVTLDLMSDCKQCVAAMMNSFRRIKHFQLKACYNKQMLTLLAGCQQQLKSFRWSTYGNIYFEEISRAPWPGLLTHLTSLSIYVLQDSILEQLMTMLWHLPHLERLDLMLNYDEMLTVGATVMLQLYKLVGVILPQLKRISIWTYRFKLFRMAELIQYSPPMIEYIYMDPLEYEPNCDEQVFCGQVFELFNKYKRLQVLRLRNYIYSRTDIERCWATHPNACASFRCVVKQSISFLETKPIDITSVNRT